MTCTCELVGAELTPQIAVHPSVSSYQHLLAPQVWEFTSDGVLMQAALQTCLVPASIGN